MLIATVEQAQPVGPLLAGATIVELIHYAMHSLCIAPFIMHRSGVRSWLASLAVTVTCAAANQTSWHAMGAWMPMHASRPCCLAGCARGAR